MQPNTLTGREYKGKIYVKNIRTNSCKIRNWIPIRNQLKSRIGIWIRKKSFRIHNTGLALHLVEKGTDPERQALDVEYGLEKPVCSVQVVGEESDVPGFACLVGTAALKSYQRNNLRNISCTVPYPPPPPHQIYKSV
jgi:hypothetical protein